MAGFETYLRSALTAVDLPLVIVRTRGDADFEFTGVSVAVAPDVEELGYGGTMRQDTTIRITAIQSGETVFRHSVRTVVRMPSASPRLVYWGTRSQTPSGVLATGKAAAARRCVHVLQQALNERP
jgi:hypothetical protein